MATELLDGKLRVLDQTVNTALMKILREKRKAYMTVGHGEINDPESLPPHLRGQLPDARTQVIKNILTSLNYESKNLGTMDGLASKIPDDATFVMVLGPKQAFDPAELDTLGRYLDEGGHVLIAMDPQGDFRLGPLEGRLGTGLGEVDFARIAAEAGLDSIRITDPDEVAAGLRRALSSGSPTLVDVVTDPNALSLPPQVTAQQIRGFATAAGKTVLAGGVGKMLEMARSNLRNLRGL